MFFSSVATVTAMDIFLFLLVHIVARVFCYSSGSVEESCDDLKPHHSGWSPETSLAPFTVTTDRDTYTSGEEVTGKEPGDLVLIIDFRWSKLNCFW